MNKMGELKLYRPTMIDAMVELEHMCFFPSTVHTLLPSVLQRVKLSSWSSKNVIRCRYDLIIGPILLPSKEFLILGTENNPMVPDQENMGVKPVQSHGHAQQPLQPQTCVQEHFPGETWFLRQFSRQSPKVR